jgi:predicted DNA-binding transcriptional regulator AlpA
MRARGFQTRELCVNPEDILTLPELAARLKVSKFWVYNQMRPAARAKANAMPALKIGGLIRFHWPDVAAWLLAQHKHVEKPKPRQFRRKSSQGGRRCLSRN